MEYHKDRFTDFSLMIYKNETLVALLPANKSNDSIYSHQGLTYGGLVFGNKTEMNFVYEVTELLKTYFTSQQINWFYCKLIPQIYYKVSAKYLDYVLSKKAMLKNRALVLAIDYSQPLQIHKTKLKHYRKGEIYNFDIVETKSYTSFWNTVLSPRLIEKHNVKPVHTLKEIENLSNKFPDNIKQFNIIKDGELLAGITIFETQTVVKSQYGATTVLGEKYRALDYLFLYLIKKYKVEGKQYFSMGTVMDNSILGVNEGLLKQKEELGCQIYFQDTFKMNCND